MELHKIPARLTNSTESLRAWFTCWAISIYLKGTATDNRHQETLHSLAHLPNGCPHRARAQPRAQIPTKASVVGGGIQAPETGLQQARCHSMYKSPRLPELLPPSASPSASPTACIEHTCTCAEHHRPRGSSTDEAASVPSFLVLCETRKAQGLNCQLLAPIRHSVQRVSTKEQRAHTQPPPRDAAHTMALQEGRCSRTPGRGLRKSSVPTDRTLAGKTWKCLPRTMSYGKIGGQDR